MIVEVVALPGDLREIERKVAIVVDALRASATIVTLLESGAPEIVVAASPSEAFEIAGAERERFAICGEVNGLPPAGFDYGNSPTRLSGADLGGRTVVLTTSNGTRALRAVAEAPLALVGTGRNGRAVARRALEAAEQSRTDLVVVCAGDDRGVHFSLEDYYFAGYLVELIGAARAFTWPVDESDPGAGDPSRWVLDESAVAARRVYRSYQAEASGDRSAELAMFAEARNGHSLPRLGYGDDLAYCAGLSCSDVVPTLEVRGGRYLLVDRS